MTAVEMLLRVTSSRTSAANKTTVGFLINKSIYILYMSTMCAVFSHSFSHFLLNFFIFSKNICVTFMAIFMLRELAFG